MCVLTRPYAPPKAKSVTRFKRLRESIGCPKMFRVFFSSHGERAFRSLSQIEKKIIIRELEKLASDLFWHHRVRKLQGSADRYRLRVGRWRVLFNLKDGEIEIVDIFLRKESGDYRRRGL